MIQLTAVSVLCDYDRFDPAVATIMSKLANNLDCVARGLLPEKVAGCVTITSDLGVNRNYFRTGLPASSAAFVYHPVPAGHHKTRFTPCKREAYTIAAMSYQEIQTALQQQLTQYTTNNHVPLSLRALVHRALDDRSYNLQQTWTPNAPVDHGRVGDKSSNVKSRNPDSQFYVYNTTPGLSEDAYWDLCQAQKDAMDEPRSIQLRQLLAKANGHGSNELLNSCDSPHRVNRWLLPRHLQRNMKVGDVRITVTAILWYLDEPQLCSDYRILPSYHHPIRCSEFVQIAGIRPTRNNKQEALAYDLDQTWKGCVFSHFELLVAALRGQRVLKAAVETRNGLDEWDLWHDCITGGSLRQLATTGGFANSPACRSILVEQPADGASRTDYIVQDPVWEATIRDYYLSTLCNYECSNRCHSQSTSKATPCPDHIRWLNCSDLAKLNNTNHTFVDPGRYPLIHHNLTLNTSNPTELYGLLVAPYHIIKDGFDQCEQSYAHCYQPFREHDWTNLSKLYQLDSAQHLDGDFYLIKWQFVHVERTELLRTTWHLSDLPTSCQPQVMAMAEVRGIHCAASETDTDRAAVGHADSQPATPLALPAAAQELFNRLLAPNSAGGEGSTTGIHQAPVSLSTVFATRPLAKQPTALDLFSRLSACKSNRQDTVKVESVPIEAFPALANRRTVTNDIAAWLERNARNNVAAQREFFNQYKQKRFSVKVLKELKQKFAAWSEGEMCWTEFRLAKKEAKR